MIKQWGYGFFFKNYAFGYAFTSMFEDDKFPLIYLGFSFNKETKDRFERKYKGFWLIIDFLGLGLDLEFYKRYGTEDN